MFRHLEGLSASRVIFACAVLLPTPSSRCYLFDVEGATELACTQPETVNFGPEFRCRTKGCPVARESARAAWGLAFRSMLSKHVAMMSQGFNHCK